MTMKTLFVLSAVLVAVLGGTADTYTRGGIASAPKTSKSPGNLVRIDNTYDNNANTHNNQGYGNNHNQGYGGNQGGYGRGGAGFFAPPKNQAQDDLVDKYFSSIGNTADQLKSSAEQLYAAEARLGDFKRLVDQIDLLLEKMENGDAVTDAEITELEKNLATVNSDLTTLEAETTALEQQNSANNDNQAANEKTIADENARDIIQEGQIVELETGITGARDAVNQILDNAIELFQDRVEAAVQALASVEATENRRICESGKVTLDGDDRRAEYSYQSHFTVVPSLVYGICGVDFNLDAQDEQTGYGGHGAGAGYGYGGYGYGYGYEDPNAIGVTVTAYSSKKVAVLEAFDLSFGDTAATTVSVCFQACSVGPGYGPVYA